MILSIIIPVLNEERHILDLIASLIQEDGIEKEVFLVDGGSTDQTISIIKEEQKKHPNIFLEYNKKKFVSHGFNKTYQKTKGKYITLLGAHSVYPDAFFKAGISELEAGSCDVIGGPLKQHGKTCIGESIAYAMSCRFGVGGTEFRTEKKRMYVDSVAFAIYRKEIFDHIGLLDEELIRNQDDELHYRINANNYRILMIPEMECTYYVRNSIQSLFKQYFAYGFYKPLVLKKVRQAIRFRHLIPAAFTLYLITLPLIAYYWWWFLPFTLYLAFNIFFSIQNLLPLKNKLLLPVIFFTLHLSYGLGFILGLPKLFSKK